ncbi:hypothetical protein [Methylobacterium segetis]|uniref:hypothetical protein n=1 Tax=Methylobacterium segetis TaxID=2488750 RepID=UPI001A9EDCDA|nr:hypothetical protein [Methylobacterium segetis]
MAPAWSPERRGAGRGARAPAYLCGNAVAVIQGEFAGLDRDEGLRARIERLRQL